jgi:DNA helicase-2/ATP-dependent DNA helicase PcrA
LVPSKKTHPLLQKLNASQREAVEHTKGPLLIVAGPGSGKTRVIVHRIAYLIQVAGIEPHSICAVTFTNKAALEMQERLARLLGPKGKSLSCSTFHALCARILRREGSVVGLARNFVIYDDDDQMALMTSAIKTEGLDPKLYNPRVIHNMISAAKAKLVGIEEFGSHARGPYERIAHQIYQSYQELLVRNQAVDFDDLLLRTWRLFREHPIILERYQSRYSHLLVDEFQDTNVTQYGLMHQLSGYYRNICVVGDPDQAIYSWRHADARNILSFQRDFPDAPTVHLHENYRSTQVILDAAQHVIASNDGRIDKHLFTQRLGGTPLVVKEAYNEEEEASWVIREVCRLHQEEGYAYADCAVMYRVNTQSRAMEEACLRQGVPYRLVGTLRFNARREIKDILSYLRLVLNPYDEVSLERVINVPPRGIGQKTRNDLTAWARSVGLPKFTALGLLAENPKPLEPADEPSTQEPSITASSRDALLRFYITLQELTRASTKENIVDLLDTVLERTGYRNWLLEEEQDEERLENLLELRGLAAEFDHLEPQDGLAALVERVSLASPQDNMGIPGNRDALTLITLHQAKGLEFRSVFMTGMEEGLLPHRRSLDDTLQMSEERRLCYVGMTRAQERLYLVRAFRRRIMGERRAGVPSRFLQDIPMHLLRTPYSQHSTAPNYRSNAAVDTEAAAVQEKLLFYAGERVRHPTFGEGVVISSVTSRGDYQVTVAFKGKGIKRLLHSIAPLEKVG